MTDELIKRKSKPRAARRKTTQAPVGISKHSGMTVLRGWRIKRTHEERKAKAIELCLRAVSGGWTIAKFVHWSGVGKSSMLRWLAEETVQPRFIAAMQVKALALPDEAMELVRQLVAGGKYVMALDAEGRLVRTWLEFTPTNIKAIAVGLRHYEFRMMREIKALYQPSRTVTNIHEHRTKTDDEIEKEFGEIEARILNAARAGRQVLPAAGRGRAATTKQGG